MTILEKIKIWCKLKPRRQVRIYSMLERLAKALKNTGLSKAAEQLDDILSWGAFPDDILESASSVLRRIRHSKKLPPALGREIRMIEFAIWGLWHGLFSIAPTKDPEMEPAAFCSTRTDASLPLDCNKIIADGGSRYGDFELMKCGNCGAFALYDNECCEIHLNAHDLSLRYLYALSNQPSLQCPYCGVPEAFDTATSEDADAIRKSEWAGFIQKEKLTK